MTAEQCRREGDALYDKANAYPIDNTTPAVMHIAINIGKALWEIAAQLAELNERQARRER
jgi:hypothetical protein